MNDPFYLFFRFGPALQALFEMDYLPAREDFKELTPSQYLKYIDEYGETEEKIYSFLPEDPMEYSRFNSSHEDTIMLVSDSEMFDILNAVTYVENLCAESQWQLTTKRAKLSYAAQRLPDVFSKGTSYETFKKNKTHIVE